MANDRKKFQKKKDRERRVRKQILAQREAIRAPEREERQFQKKLKRIEKLKKDMGKMNVWADEVFLNMSDDSLSQLERNALILKALEQEYQKEKDKKKQLNDELEEQGLLTLDQKLQHLHDKLVHQAKEMYESGGLEATEAPAEPPRSDLKPAHNRNVADIEVVRAPSSCELAVGVLEGLADQPADL